MLQSTLRYFVTWVDGKNPLQANTAFFIRVNRTTQPQPSHFILLVLLDNLLQQGACFCSLSCFEGSDSLRQ
jgi:hypothetical protein